MIAPKGTIYNPNFPRACSGRFMKCERICDNVILALSEPWPERTRRATAPCATRSSLQRLQPEKAQYWVYMEINESSYGGRYGKDGLDSVDSLLVNTRNNPIEELEVRYPLRCERYELRSEAPAPGLWRGGIGIIRETAPGRRLRLLRGRPPLRPAPRRLWRQQRPGGAHAANPGGEREEGCPRCSPA